MTIPITLALAEQSELTRSGLEALVRPYDVRLAAPGDGCRADVTLFDTDAPLDPAKIHDLAARPGTGHLVLYSWNRPTADIRLAMAAGAHGFLPKSLPTHSLIPALTRITAGEMVVLRPTSPVTGTARTST